MIHRHPWFLVLLLVALFDPTASIAAESVPVHQCDRLAADPRDYERVAPPVDDLRFLPKLALGACREAVAAYPNEPRFRFQLGRALLGLGDVDESRAALQDAADKGYAVANLFLGRMFESGSYGERNVERAFEYYRLAAEQGHQDAQIGVGLMYRRGVGVKADTWQAFNWFKKAADQDNPHAHFFLGTMYTGGEHTPPGERPIAEPAMAVRHFEIAAAAGIPGGQFALGLMYLGGFPVEKDTARGLELMEAAAEQGFVVASLQLGHEYMRGENLPKNQERAIYWFCRAGAVGRNIFRETYDESLNCDGRL